MKCGERLRLTLETPNSMTDFPLGWGMASMSGCLVQHCDLSENGRDDYYVDYWYDNIAISTQLV